MENHINNFNESDYKILQQYMDSQSDTKIAVRLVKNQIIDTNKNYGKLEELNQNNLTSNNLIFKIKEPNENVFYSELNCDMIIKGEHNNFPDEFGGYFQTRIQADKNLSFFCLGNSQKDSFFFGSANYFTHNSFCINSIKLVINLLKKTNPFDIILIDYIKINKDKFLLDHRNLQFNFQVSIIDFLNFISSTEFDQSLSCSTFVVFKFFKYIDDNDQSKTERVSFKFRKFL